MKFYYKGQLVRTSKTRMYKWAVVEERDDGSLKVYGCRAKREPAEDERRYWVSRGHAGVRVVPLSTEPNPEGLTYEQFIALAKANYDKGGDGYVNSWDERTFNYFVENFGVITEAGALDAFAQALDNEREEQAIAAEMDRRAERAAD